jgi:bifunctional DNA-binding transcriptional regulator/antitoxin component of YhaV-PrlF toxin-antitoxin module
MNMPTELRQALAAAHGGPVEITDGEQQYVLVRAEVFERFKDLFEAGDLTPEERAGLLREAGKRAGWDDPEMDVYNDLDPRRES